MGKLIAFSGLDGAGKSTQIALLEQALSARGDKTVRFWSRAGYTGPFNSLKALLRGLLGRRVVPSGHGERRDRMFRRAWVARLWLMLAVIDLIILYGGYLRLQMALGRTVIADRYLWDSWIDFRINFERFQVDRWPLWRLLRLVSPRPDLAPVLLIPVAESVRRSRLKGEPYPDTPAVLERRLAHYRCLADEQDWFVLDGLRPVREIAAAIERRIG